MTDWQKVKGMRVYNKQEGACEQSKDKDERKRMKKS